MSDEKTFDDKRNAFERILKSKAQGVRMAAVTMRTGGFAYVRQPTREEHDSFQSLTGTPAETNTAFARYVAGCFMGAIDATGKELGLDEVERLEGPSYVSQGALGVAVNNLAGAGAQPTRYF